MRIATSCLLVLALLTGACGGEAPAEKRIELTVEGMHTKDCCDTAVQAALQGVEGVIAVEVEIEKSLAVCTVDAEVEAQTLADTVNALGYKATLK